MISQCADRTDTELVALSLKDKDFFYCLVDRYEAPLRRYLSRTFFFSRADAGDVLQETFIKIYRHLNGFDPKLKFSSWAYRITHNEAISFLRKTKSRSGRDISFSDDDFNQLTSDIDLEREIDRRHSRRLLIASLQKLPDKYREVLVLKFLEEKSYEEISDIIKKPLGTVATLISRAKQRLKNIITNHE